MKTFTLQTLEGPSKIPVTLLRTSLGLRSTWVTIGVLRLDPPVGPAVLGTPLRLTGVARGLAAPALAASVDGGSNWSKVGPVSRDATGAFSIDVKPTRTTRYRLQVKEGVSPPILVRVVGK